jgi:beta-galactosidase
MRRSKSFFPQWVKQVCWVTSLLIVGYSYAHATGTVRNTQSLNSGWITVFAEDASKNTGFEEANFSTKGWQKVNVPHNWDDYGGYRRLKHGNLHGTAWYRKTFTVEKPSEPKQFFLFFEGVGSYATIWLNGDSVGYHAGGRTTFTLDVTKSIRFGKENLLAVRADHPANIRDLPWVCGGCSPAWGFCEGSQPLGIFRPVHLVATNPVRIEPFGIHIWNDSTVVSGKATLHLTSEVKNYTSKTRSILLKNKLRDEQGNLVVEVQKTVVLQPNVAEIIAQTLPAFDNPHLWSIENPYLYQLSTEIWDGNQFIDQEVTDYGIRWIKWDIFGDKPSNRFYLNGKPVFINGTAEYEHNMGQGHAFSDEMVSARVKQVAAMGFNSFRDGHQPHNFRYHEAWDTLGILWWPQMTAQIWFDTPEFKTNFKKLLTDWIKERRNSPSIILWGLQNESSLPEWYAKECTELIRELDPTTSSQRLVTTCNGGIGADWYVIQNWSGTYAGNPDKYAEELTTQVLNGEYGAWRSIDLHTEGGFVEKGAWSEDRMCLLMESKVRLAESVRDKVCGQYHWLFNSHDNPGRVQSGEGMRDIDRIGPVNYKGALTNWSEPTDLFYMFRSNYAPKETEPMVYIVSHTWPDRWTEPGVKDGIRIFTNCDEVELYNGVNENSLGKKTRRGIGTHIVFDGVNIQYNVLYAIGYVNGKAVAEDKIVLHHLPEAPGLYKLAGETETLTVSSKKKNYLYRVNCGGPDYTDAEGNLWMADVPYSGESKWGSVSWTNDYPGMPAFYGSQRQTHDPIQGTREWPLIQSFRFGQHKLAYHFPVPDGTYQVELFFVEPWYGTGGGMDCRGWRMFDVAINNNIVLNDLDIWAEAGHDKLLKKTITTKVKGGMLTISFPQVKAGQAVVSAIAISTQNKKAKPAEPSPRLITNLQSNAGKGWEAKTWMDTGIPVFSGLKGEFVALPPELYTAEWIQMPARVQTSNVKPLASFRLNAAADVYLGIDTTQIPVVINDAKELMVKGAAIPLERGWATANQEVVTTVDGSAKYKLFFRRFAERETVNLPVINPSGENLGYLVAAVPVSTLDDVIDQRPVSTWQAEDGDVKGQASKTVFAEKPCVKADNRQGSVGLKFQVGLASKYGLELRFMHWSETEQPVKVEIVSSDGRIMWSGEWMFPSTPQQWKTYRNDTQSIINAGTYTIWFTPTGNAPLWFDWMKVQ